MVYRTRSANRRLAVILILIPMILVCHQATSQQIHQEGIRSIELTGRALKATVIAYEDFSKDILTTRSSRTDTTSKYLSRLENYDIEITRGNDKYIVVFSPHFFQLPGLRGGVVEYHIDKVDFSMIEKIYGK